MQVLRQEKYMYLFLTNFVLDFVNIPKRKIFYTETKKINVVFINATCIGDGIHGAREGYRMGLYMS